MLEANETDYVFFGKQREQLGWAMDVMGRRVAWEGAFTGLWRLRDRVCWRPRSLARSHPQAGNELGARDRQGGS